MRPKTISKINILILVLCVSAISLILFFTPTNKPPYFNVEFENENHTTQKIGDSYHVNFSTIVVYKYKQAYYYQSKEYPPPDELPVRVRIFVSPWINENECCDLTSRKLVCAENITLHYREPYHFSCEFNLSGDHRKYEIEEKVEWYHYFESAGKYARWDWDTFGIGYYNIILNITPEIKQTPVPQPPIPQVSLPELQGREGAYASKLAFNDPDVQKFIDYNFEIYKVVSAGNNTSIVYFLTQKTRPPWVRGITLAVPVDLKNMEVKKKGIKFYLNFAPLTKKQKEEAVRIAMSNETVRDMVGRNYSINVSVDYWQDIEECNFHAYPAVKIGLANATLIVFVDLEEGKIVKMFKREILTQR